MGILLPDYIYGSTYAPVKGPDGELMVFKRGIMGLDVPDTWRNIFYDPTLNDATGENAFAMAYQTAGTFGDMLSSWTRAAETARSGGVDPNTGQDTKAQDIPTLLDTTVDNLTIFAALRDGYGLPTFDTMINGNPPKKPLTAKEQWLKQSNLLFGQKGQFLNTPGNQKNARLQDIERTKRILKRLESDTTNE
jgi:hypothetical protein